MLVGYLTSQQQASVSQGRICSDSCTRWSKCMQFARMFEPFQNTSTKGTLTKKHFNEKCFALFANNIAECTWQYITSVFSLMQVQNQMADALLTSKMASNGRQKKNTTHSNNTHNRHLYCGVFHWPGIVNSCMI